MNVFYSFYIIFIYIFLYVLFTVCILFMLLLHLHIFLNPNSLDFPIFLFSMHQMFLNC